MIHHFSSKCALTLATAAALLVLVPACSRKKDTGAATAQSAALVPGGPKIEFGQKEHDFGKSTEGDELKHVFSFTNRGDGPLKIERVQTSCGCTAAVLKSKEVAPGAKGEIEVTFKTQGRRGKNTKTITVVSNDSKTPRMKLQIKTDIERLLAFDPYTLRVNVGHGEEKSMEAWLTGKLADKAKLELTNVEGADNVRAELAEKTEGGKKIPGVRLHVKGDKVGSAYGKVLLKTGVEKTPNLTLPFSWTVAGNVQVRPRALFFDNRNPAGRERVIRVTSKLDKFKLTQAKVEGGSFKAKIEKPETGPGYEVRVTMPEGTKMEKGERAKLILVTNDPLEPKLEIPINLRALPRIVRPALSGLRRTPMLPRPNKPIKPR